jgi:hypothetical protein
MKLRLHGDALRLRLSQTDVARLAETGRVEETISFPGRNLTYAVAIGSAAIAARFDGERMEIMIPEDAARIWIESDQTGIENRDSSPKVLIEKDFKCLHREPGEEPDAFPNPLDRSV